MAKKQQFVEAPLTELEKVRARTMMRNNRIFQSLGIGAIASMLRKRNDVGEGSTITNDDSASAITQGESSEYNPKEDEEEVDDIVVKKKAVKASRRKKPGVKRTTKRRKSSQQTDTMAPVRVMAIPPTASKRMLDPEESAPTRVTRSKPSKQTATIHQESPLRMDRESSLQMDDELLVQMDEGSNVRRMDLSPVAPSVDRNAVFSEEQDRLEITTLVKHRPRTGAGLERLTKGMGTKLKIQIAEGMKRPEQPLQAAKLATECGLIARKHTPVLPHFKEYKKDTNLMKNYIGKVAANFDMDTNLPVNQNACSSALQRVSKNRRHLFKSKYFDKVEANQVSIKSPDPRMSDEEWAALVNMWSNPRHKQTCASNKTNRQKVVYHQKTGSRSYAAHIFATKQEHKGEELNAIDLFKSTHNSKKFGFSEPVQNAIVEMEERMKNVPEGEQPKSAVDVVGEVLKLGVKQSTFLQNAGLVSSGSKSTKASAEVVAHVRDLQDKLDRSEVDAEAMRLEMEAMKKKSEEAEAAQAVCDKDYEELRKKTQEQEDKLAHLMALFGARPAGM